MNKKWRKIVQSAVLLVLVSVLVCPLPAIAQTENAVKEELTETKDKDSSTDTSLPYAAQTENTVKEELTETEAKDSNTTPPLPSSAQTKNVLKQGPRVEKAKNIGTDPKVDALINALGGSDYAELLGSTDVHLKKSAKINSGKITVPEGYKLDVSVDENSDPITLSLGESVDFKIENNAYLSIERGGFLKVDCTITGAESSIWLGENSSISSVKKLKDKLIMPIISDAGKVVSCTDWKKERTVYAPIENNVDPEGFIIKADGRGKAYKLLGWDYGSAFNDSKAGDMIYLMKDFIVSDAEDGNTSGINNPLRAGVTFVIKDGQTFDIGIVSLMCIAGETNVGKGEGAILALAGSQCRLPWSSFFERTTFVGTDANAMVKLDMGAFKLQLPQYPVSPMTFSAARKAVNKTASSGAPAQATLTKNSKATVQTPLSLRVMNDALNCVMEEHSQLMVTDLLALDGNGEFTGKTPGKLTLEKGSKIQAKKDGVVFLDKGTETVIKSEAELSTGFIDGDKNIKDKPNGFKLYIQGTIIAEAKAAMNLQNKKLIGGSDACISIINGKGKLNLADPDHRLELTDGSEAMLNNDWNYGLTSENAPHNNYLKDLTIGKDSTFTLNAALTLPADASLNLNGKIVVGSKGTLILDENSTFNNNGKIIVMPGGEVRGTSSFKLEPSQGKEFRSEKEGYMNPETLDVTVKSNGTQDTGNLTTALSGKNADSFSLTPSGDIGSLSPGSAPKSFTVSPKTGLKKGTYKADVAVSGDRISMTFPVSFTVTKDSSKENENTPEDNKPNSGGDKHTSKTGNDGRTKSDRVRRHTPMTGDTSSSLDLPALLMLLSLVVGGTIVLGYKRKNRG